MSGGAQLLRERARAGMVGSRPDAHAVQTPPARALRDARLETLGAQLMRQTIGVGTTCEAAELHHEAIATAPGSRRGRRNCAARCLGHARWRRHRRTRRRVCRGRRRRWVGARRQRRGLLRSARVGRCAVGARFVGQVDRVGSQRRSFCGCGDGPRRRPDRSCQQLGYQQHDQDHENDRARQPFFHLDHPAWGRTRAMQAPRTARRRRPLPQSAANASISEAS